MLKRLPLPGITPFPFSRPKIAPSFSIPKPKRTTENDERSPSLASSMPSFFRQSEESRIVQRGARRRSVRQEEEDDDEEYGHNREIEMIEMYSQSVREEALIVHALVDAEEVQVLIFKGFSSSLSFSTWSDPSRSILPARAEIQWIDRVKGPFDPANIQYIQKNISWESFQYNCLPKSH